MEDQAQSNPQGLLGREWTMDLADKERLEEAIQELNAAANQPDVYIELDIGLIGGNTVHVAFHEDDNEARDLGTVNLHSSEEVKVSLSFHDDEEDTPKTNRMVLLFQERNATHEHSSLGSDKAGHRGAEQAD